MSIEVWWPKLQSATRDWLIANNGDAVPTPIVEAGGPGQSAWWGGQEGSGNSFMPDEATDWIEEIANDETPAGRPPGSRRAAPSHGADVVDLADKLALVSEHWSPKTVAGLNDYEIKVVKLAGEFVWHTHEHTDELFLVLSGRLTIRFRDGDVVLGPGQLVVVPRGVEHCPVAQEEVHAVLIEPQGTVNTGDAGGPLTAEPDNI